jgi:undecaprenyl-diphosphatase
MLGLIALASVPGAAAGLLFEKAAEETLRSPALIGALLIAFGLLLEAADRFGRKGRAMGELSWAGGLIIGAAQALAIAPGVSRSGSTMTAGLALGLTREAAARFSFLLATPIIAGASLLKLRHLHAADLTGPFWAGVIVSAVSGLAAVRFLMTKMPSHGLRPYTLYRVAAGLGVLAVYALR